MLFLNSPSLAHEHRPSRSGISNPGTSALTCSLKNIHRKHKHPIGS